MTVRAHSGFPLAWSTAVGIRHHVAVEPLPVKLIFGRMVTVAIG
jgi:hypothetical protein